MVCGIHRRHWEDGGETIGLCSIIKERKEGDYRLVFYYCRTRNNSEGLFFSGETEKQRILYRPWKGQLHQQQQKKKKNRTLKLS